MYNSFHIHFPYRPLCGYKGDRCFPSPHSCPPPQCLHSTSLFDFYPWEIETGTTECCDPDTGVEFGPTKAIPLLELCLCCIRQPHPVKHQPDTTASTPNG